MEGGKEAAVGPCGGGKHGARPVLREHTMKKKVLVVDDSELVYQELRYHLGRCGRYEAAYYCPDASRLVELYEEHRPDLVAVDVVMPGIDGIQAAKKLLAKHPEARVVIITSMVYTEIMEEAEAAGARGFLPKALQPPADHPDL